MVGDGVVIRNSSEEPAPLSLDAPNSSRGCITIVRGAEDARLSGETWMREEQPVKLTEQQSSPAGCLCFAAGFVWELTICLVAKGSEMC